MYFVCASVHFSIRLKKEEGPRSQDEGRTDSKTQSFTPKTPTLTDSPFQPAYLDFVLGLSVYHWRKAWFDRASGNNRVGDREGKKEEENDRGKERERKEAPQWHLEITPSPELLFSCYHFPRQHSCHRSVFELTVCLFKWVTLVHVRINSEHQDENCRRILNLNEKMREVIQHEKKVHLKQTIKTLCVPTCTPNTAWSKCTWLHLSKMNLSHPSGVSGLWNRWTDEG